jgi:AcrR family transcriptional regulator
VGSQDYDDGPFLPLRLLYGRGRPGAPDQVRERAIAEHMDKLRDEGKHPKGRGRGLSRVDIVDIAIAIADAEGTDAVSIRRIAKDLRAGAMSLYWHVSSKDELHLLMLEQVQAEIEAAEPSGDWRGDLRAYAGSARAALLRHPWAIGLGGGPPTGPNDARNAERLLGALDGLGLDLPTMLWIAMTVGTYVTGAALNEIQEIRWQQAASADATGMSEDEINEKMAEFARGIRESAAYPHLMRLIDTDFDPDAPETRDERFEFGLSCVLDGIAARIARNKDR